VYKKITWKSSKKILLAEKRKWSLRQVFSEERDKVEDKEHMRCIVFEKNNEIEILDVRYDMWVNPKTPYNKVTWILRQIQKFMEPMQPQRG
jgi:hypothetical protein